MSENNLKTSNKTFWVLNPEKFGEAEELFQQQFLWELLKLH